MSRLFIKIQKSLFSSLTILIWLLLLTTNLYPQFMDWKLIQLDYLNGIETSSSNYILAFSETKLFKSTNDGSDWLIILSDFTPSCLEIIGDTILIGDYNGKLLVSVNAGLSFSEMSSFASKISAVKSTAIADTNYIFVGTSSSGAYVSTDFGNTWEARTFTTKEIRCFDVFDDTILAGTYGDGLFISDDYGNSWNKKIIAQPDENIWAIEAIEELNSIFIAADKLYKSNKGLDWTVVGDFKVYSIKYSSPENEIFAGDYKSNDEGISWKHVFPGRALRIAIEDTTTYMLDFDSKLYKENHSPYNGINYFPLKIGNTWQYLTGDYYSTGIGNPSRTYGFKIISVTNDTLINDKMYYEVMENGFYQYLRLTEDNLIYRLDGDSEVVHINFNLKWGEYFSYNNSWASFSERYTTLFGSSRHSKDLTFHRTTRDNNTLSFADSVGCFKEFSSFWGPLNSHSEYSAQLIQVKVQIGDSLYKYKTNHVSTVTPDSINLLNDSLFAINITATHPYDRQGSTPEKSAYFVKDVLMEYFLTQNSDTLYSGSISLNRQQYTNNFNGNIEFECPLAGEGIKLYYKFYITDLGIIPATTEQPESGYHSLSVTPTDISGSENIIFGMNLFQNYPNPFNPQTSISYSISKAQLVTIKLYDILGNQIGILVNEEKAPGEHQVILDGSKLSSGVYFYTIRSGNFTQTKKMVLTK